MIIRFLQSGGFAGLRRGTTLNTEQMSPDDAEILVDLVTSLRADPPRKQGQHADEFQFRVRVEEGAVREEYQLSESTLNESQQQLVDFLTARSEFNPKE